MQSDLLYHLAFECAYFDSDCLWLYRWYRALHHLGRLKHLVDDIKEKKEREQRVVRNHHIK